MTYHANVWIGAETWYPLVILARYLSRLAGPPPSMQHALRRTAHIFRIYICQYAVHASSAASPAACWLENRPRAVTHNIGKSDDSTPTFCLRQLPALIKSASPRRTRCSR